MRDPILLMTRPRPVSERFVARLDANAVRGVQVVHAPLIEIVEMGQDKGQGANLDGKAGVIFTSGNGVRFAPKGAGRPAFCVGRATARDAKAAGWDVKTVQQDAAHLVRAMQGMAPIGSLVHLSGQHRRGDIADILRTSGLHVEVQVLYDQALRPLTPQAARILAGEAPVILPLFSPRTAAHLASQVSVSLATTILAMSGAVADCVKRMQVKEVQVVAKPTGQDMVQGIEMLLHKNRLS